MPDNQFIRFRLDLDYDQFLRVYQGIANTVITYSDDGRKLAFPAAKVQRYLTKAGIHGHFEMELTAKNKFVSITRLS